MKRAISFNGGKESLIILHKYYRPNDIVFRVKMENEFEEIEEHINDIEKIFGIKVLVFQNDNLKECIDILKNDYQIDIVVLGVRKTDPNCQHLNTYQITDNGWPSIMRYHPLLEWTYNDVWDYIDMHNLPICSLYENGFTSLGYKGKTFPNFSLFKKGKFCHAKNLIDETLEREGRINVELPVSFSGKVIHGKGLGKGLGFPTANLNTRNVILEDGVYCGRCVLLGCTENMIMSVGTNPTINDNNDNVKTIEIHILKKYNADFYDEVMDVIVEHFIRKMKKYSSLEQLIEAIENDVEIANFLLS